MSLYVEVIRYSWLGDVGFEEDSEGSMWREGPCLLRLIYRKRQYVTLLYGWWKIMGFRGQYHPVHIVCDMVRTIHKGRLVCFENSPFTLRYINVTQTLRKYCSRLKL